MAAERRPPRARRAGRSSRVLLRPGIHALGHAPRHDARGLVAERAALRSRSVRRPGDHGSVARARGALPARLRHPRRARSVRRHPDPARNERRRAECHRGAPPCAGARAAHCLAAGGRARGGRGGVTLQARGAVEKLGPWFHNLHLPDGRQTAPDHPLGDFPRFKWLELEPHLPESLDGWSALDIGCNAGFYSFELARRGAEVVGIDADDHYLEQARWARSLYGYDERVELRRQTVYDLARSDETFDLVLFMGVLYHLRHPLLALDAVAARARTLVVLQTLTVETDNGRAGPRHFANLDWEERGRLLEEGWPAMLFVEQKLFGDPTNWWVPTPAAVEAMARTAGLEILEHPVQELWLCRPAGAKREVLDELRAASGSSAVSD